MKIGHLIAAAIFACAIVPLAGVASADAATSSTQPITITASNWKFAPAEITVQVNQPVTLDLTSSEGVHGLQSSDLGIAQTMILPGATKTVTFTPKKVGTYVVHCSIPCGEGHAKMALTIHVVASQ